MTIPLHDKVALITGGSRGIGAGVAKAFAKSGATVVITYTHATDKATALTEKLREENAKVSAYQVDVRDSGAMTELAKFIVTEFGRIDILVNNAGIIRDTLLVAMEPRDWTDVIETNLTGTYNATRAVARYMMANRSGSVINMSSVAAKKPGKGHCNYAASKAGIEGMTKALAVELGAKGIRVNSIAPGMIETDMSKDIRDMAAADILKMIVLKRFGAVEDIANAALFLASDLSAYITGVTIPVDGGMKA